MLKYNEAIKIFPVTAGDCYKIVCAGGGYISRLVETLVIINYLMVFIPEEEIKMERNTIAAQLYTLRDFTKDEAGIKSAFKKIKEIGYNAVQVSGIGPVDPFFVKETADEFGLKICATHIPMDSLRNDMGNVIKKHKLWDCKYVGLGSMPGDLEKTGQNYRKFAKEASELAKVLYDNGLKFIYHNHMFEFQKYDGITGLEILIEETDPEIFGFEPDTYWIQAGGGNPEEWLRKLKGRIDVVHFKDMAIFDNKQEMAEIGRGNLEWPPIIRICREQGVKWYAVEQDICRGNPFESLSVSLKYLEGYC